MTLSERNAKIEAHNKKVLERIVKTEKPNNSRFKDLSGNRFFDLKILSYAGTDKPSNGEKFYWVSCSCGSNPKLVSSSNLRKGKTKSCGCLKSKQASNILQTHGLAYDPWFKIATGQEQRMKNPKRHNYHDYGGRGLVFGEGMESIEERVLFYREFFGPEPPAGMQVDRIDNDRGYAKDNVRLCSIKENALNRRDSHGHNADGLKSRAYKAWANNKKKGNLCDEWAADFKVFLADIGGRDLPKGKYLARFDVEKPFDPDNYYFSDTIQRIPSYLMPK